MVGLMVAALLPALAAPVDAASSSRNGLIVFTEELPFGSGVQTTIRVMEPDGSGARTVLGGAWQPTWSPDGRQIAFSDYPGGVSQVFVMNADGTGQVQVTSNGAANFAPYWHPSGDRILFSSNMDDPTGRDFDIYMIGVDGTGLERVTHTGGFDGFPVFSPDGRWLVWGSNRNEAHEGNTNLFIAEWVETP